MPTEISKFDTKSIVVHTTDNETYYNLKKLGQCFKEVPYYHVGKLIAWDLYFPKEYRKQVTEICRSIAESPPS